MKHFFFLLVFAFAISSQLVGQIKTPSLSPSCKISQEIGLSKIEIDYSRPSARGRKVMGDLVPLGELWRTGANASTKINIGESVKIGGLEVNKGEYALYSVPGEKEWEIILYKNTSFWGVPEKAAFKEEDVAVRLKVPSHNTKEMVETFTIGFNNIKNNSADLELSWEYTKIQVPFVFDIDAKVMSEIKTQMDGPNANTLYQAARYYYEEKKDMTQALEWVEKSLEKGGEKFFILRLKANILAELGRYTEAITAAEKSTLLAKENGNSDYPRLNEKSITEWKKKG